MAEDGKVSFDEFVTSHGDTLRKLAFAVLGDAHLADDAAQAALAKVLRHWDRIEHPRSYSQRAVVTECVDRQRKARREVPRSPTSFQDLRSSSAGDPAKASESRQARDELWRAVLALPARQRAVLALRYFEELSDAEIAQILSIRPGTVRSTAARALATLRSKDARR